MRNKKYSQEVQDAILELDSDKYKNLTSESKLKRLKEIANTLSADTKGEISVFYSGMSEEFIEKITDMPNIRIINNTDVADFLKSREFQTALADTIGINFKDIKKNTLPQPLVDLYNSKLFNTDISKGELGFWAEASKRFAISTENNIIAFVGEKAKIEKTFGFIELPELTKKDNLHLNDKLIKDLKQEAKNNNIDINIKAFEYAKKTTSIQEKKLLSDKSVSQERATQAAGEQQERRVLPPRHDDLNKNQAQIHVDARERIAENVDALKQNPTLAGRSAHELERIAYFRGILQEDIKSETPEAQREILTDFERAVEAPAYLKRLEEIGQDHDTQEQQTERQQERQEARKKTSEQSLER